MAHQPLVNFLIAGVQKGGTTALFDYLSDYPDIALPSEKELHFFDDDARDWAQPDYADYHAHFPAPDGRPSGEATPIYAYWPGALERIAAYNPEMKLIFALRDPVERAWSHWRMEHARGYETRPFGWCIREGRERLADAPPQLRRVYSYVERGFYGAQLERVFALFPKHQVLVLKSEDLRREPGPVLGRVRTFLDLPPAPAPAPRESHIGPQSGELAAEDIACLREVYQADSARLETLTGIRFP
ncbi:sulfotransferase family protein [Phenylobacterium sp.]|jgi:hypothetical protein|uniref:sulfotransferase family protein n=1 Tax=Phenylobacterium sp. TaxID=1871053 RepID=UPI002E33D25B|nr:sulfotransferase domain-containing protein [Phenylobacterium sp.]HEX2558808.1 sulfotransferase domain-containing protein [Phenylobacterium sp.]